MRSSLQNVNIHRTTEDALQTVPSHLWQTAATQRGCSWTSRSLLKDSFTFPTCSQWWPSGWCASSFSFNTPATHSPLSVTLSFFFFKGFEGAQPERIMCLDLSVHVWKLHGVALSMAGAAYLSVKLLALNTRLTADSCLFVTVFSHSVFICAAVNTEGYYNIFLSINHVVSSNDHVTFCYMFDMLLCYRAIIVLCESVFSDHVQFEGWKQS